MLRMRWVPAAVRPLAARTEVLGQHVADARDLGLDARELVLRARQLRGAALGLHASPADDGTAE